LIEGSLGAQSRPIFNAVALNPYIRSTLPNDRV
jgi:hypothetical protein